MRIEPFGVFHAPLARVEFRGDAARGHRLVGPIVDSRIDAPQLRAGQVGTSAADWLLWGPGGTVFIDVRVSMRTDDGASLQIAYSGRAHWPDGIGSGAVRAAFAVETDAPQYRWLCSRLLVGVGSVDRSSGQYALALVS